MELLDEAILCEINNLDDFLPCTKEEINNFGKTGSFFVDENIPPKNSMQIGEGHQESIESHKNTQMLGETFVCSQNNEKQNKTITILRDQLIVFRNLCNLISDKDGECSKKTEPNSAFENSPVKKPVVFEKLGTQVITTKPSNLNKKMKTKETKRDKDFFRHHVFERDADDRFICPLCSSSYKQRPSLTNHLRYRCGVEPQFECPICSRTFYQKGNLKTHIANIHGDNRKSKSLKRAHEIGKRNQINNDDETKHQKSVDPHNDIQTLGEAFVQNDEQQNPVIETMVFTGVADGTHVDDKHVISNETTTIPIDPKMVVTTLLNTEVKLSDSITNDEYSKKTGHINELENNSVKKCVEVFEKLDAQSTANKPSNLNEKLETKGTENNEGFRRIVFKRDANNRFICPLCSTSYKHSPSLINHLRYRCGVEPQFECPICSRMFHHKGNVKTHIAHIHGNNRKSKSLKRAHEIGKRNQINNDDETKHQKSVDPHNDIQTLGEAFVQNDEQQNPVIESMVFTEVADGTHVDDKLVTSNETTTIPKDPKMVVTTLLNTEVKLSDSITNDEYSKKTGHINEFENNSVKKCVEVFEKLDAQSTANKPSNLNEKLETKGTENNEGFRRIVFKRDANNRFLCLQCNSSFKQKYSLFSHMRYRCGVEPQFECPICSRTFHYKGSMKTHIANMHGDNRKSKSLKRAHEIGKRNQINNDDETKHQKSVDPHNNIQTLGEAFVQNDEQQNPVIETMVFTGVADDTHVDDKPVISNETTTIPKDPKMVVTTLLNTEVKLSDSITNDEYSKKTGRINAFENNSVKKCVEIFQNLDAQSTANKPSNINEKVETKGTENNEGSRRIVFKRDANNRFLCLQCNSSFKQKYSLFSHMRYRCGVEPQFECPICSRTFHHKGSMKTHIANIHSDNRKSKSPKRAHEIGKRNQINNDDETKHQKSVDPHNDIQTLGEAFVQNDEQQNPVSETMVFTGVADGTHVDDKLVISNETATIPKDPEVVVTTLLNTEVKLSDSITNDEYSKETGHINEFENNSVKKCVEVFEKLDAQSTANKPSNLNEKLEIKGTENNEGFRRIVFKRDANNQFLCPQCNSSFKQKYSLFSHMRYRCGVEPQFECPIYSKMFHHKGNMKTHIANIHGHNRKSKSLKRAHEIGKRNQINNDDETKHQMSVDPHNDIQTLDEAFVQNDEQQNPVIETMVFTGVADGTHVDDTQVISNETTTIPKDPEMVVTTLLNTEVKLSDSITSDEYSKKTGHINAFENNSVKKCVEVFETLDAQSTANKPSNLNEKLETKGTENNEGFRRIVFKRDANNQFLCPQCNSSFKQKYSLFSHMRYRCGVEPQFECPIYSKMFHHKGNMKTHIANIHGDNRKSKSLKRAHEIGKRNQINNDDETKHQKSVDPHNNIQTLGEAFVQNDEQQNPVIETIVFTGVADGTHVDDKLVISNETTTIPKDPKMVVTTLLNTEVKLSDSITNDEYSKKTGRINAFENNSVKKCVEIFQNLDAQSTANKPSNINEKVETKGTENNEGSRRIVFKRDANNRFLCLQCNSSFKQKYSLFSHMRYRCGVEPQFECPICSRTFHHKGSMKTHIANIHSDNRKSKSPKRAHEIGKRNRINNDDETKHQKSVDRHNDIQTLGEAFVQNDEQQNPVIETMVFTGVADGTHVDDTHVISNETTTIPKDPEMVVTTLLNTEVKLSDSITNDEYSKKTGHINAFENNSVKKCVEVFQTLDAQSTANKPSNLNEKAETKGTENNEGFRGIVFKRNANNRFLCPQCNSSFKQKYSLFSHMIYRCGVEPQFECPICSKMFPHEGNMKAHIANIHGDNRKSNSLKRAHEIGKRNQINNDDETKHQKSVDPHNDIQILGEAFVQNDEQQNPVIDTMVFTGVADGTHVDDKPIISNETTTIPKDPEMAVTTLLNTEVKLSDSITNYSKKTGHINAFENNSVKKCAEVFEKLDAQLTANKPSNLNEKVETKGTENNEGSRRIVFKRDANNRFLCLQCNSSFKQKYSLFSHMRYRCGVELQFECPICSRTFHHKGSMKTHIANIHSDNRKSKSLKRAHEIGKRNQINNDDETKHQMSVDPHNDIQTLGEAFVQNDEQQNPVSESMVFTGVADGTHVDDTHVISNETATIPKDPEVVVTTLLNTEVKLSDSITNDEYSKKTGHINAFENNSVKKCVEVFETLDAQSTANKPSNLNEKVETKRTENNEGFRRIVFKRDANNQFLCPQCNSSFKQKYSLFSHMRYRCGVEPQFECPIYSKMFHHKGNMKTHIANIHGDNRKSKSLKRAHEIGKRNQINNDDETKHQMSVDPHNDIQTLGEAFVQNDEQQNPVSESMVFTGVADGTHVDDKPIISNETTTIPKDPEMVVTTLLNTEVKLSDSITNDEYSKKAGHINVFENNSVKKCAEVFEKLNAQLTANKPSNLNEKVETKGTEKNDVFRHIVSKHDANNLFLCPLCNSSFKQNYSLLSHLRYFCGVDPQFKCPICSRAFHHKGNMKTHIANIHGDNRKSKSVKSACKITKQNEVTNDDEVDLNEETAKKETAKRSFSTSPLSNMTKRHKPVESCNNIQKLGEAFIQNKQHNPFGQTMVTTGLAEGTHVCDKSIIPNKTITVLKDQRIFFTIPLNAEDN